MYNDTITVERLEQIEREREETYADQAYQRWMKELRVASMWVDRQPVLNARELMQDWDIRRLRTDRLTDWTN
jgi:hypothetical protein